MSTVVTRDAEDGLSGESWAFGIKAEHWSNTVYLTLDSYTYWERPTRRHKPQARSFWRRLNSRDNTMERQSVPLPDDVVSDAKHDVRIVMAD